MTPPGSGGSARREDRTWRVACGNAPTFFILGGAKCGTTTLYHLLRQAEQVFLTARKEPRFFGNTPAFEKGFEWYLDEYFKGAEAYPARGEATPQYLHGRRLVAERIRAALGDDLKFVVLIRDPVKRAWSHYLHMRRLGSEDLSFRQALAAEASRLEDHPESWFGYYTDGLFGAALEDWFDAYPRERFLILPTERLQRDPQIVLGEVCEFLDVDPPASLELRVDANSAADARNRVVATLLNRPNAITNLLKLAVPYKVRQGVRDAVNAWNRAHYASTPPSMSPDLERRLRRAYADDVRRLESLTGLALEDWYP